jgi:PAS domain-containing protein
MTELPDWVRRFNAEGNVNRYFGAVWERALPEERYRHLDRDDVPYEKDENGMDRAFPHRIDGGTPERITRAYYAALRSSPFANELTIALAREALRAEELGRRGVTDMLAVSLSANDYLGHAFGPHSHEVFDLVVRTDRLLAGFWTFLDETVGLENCTIALTADHGVAPIPEYITGHVPGAATRRIDPKDFLHRLEERLALPAGAAQGDPGWIERVQGDNIYLNLQALAAAGVSRDDAARALKRAAESLPEVYAAYTQADILDSPATTPVHRRVRNSFYAQRSGDLVVVLQPGLLPSGSQAGTSHGSPYPYDAHVPVMLAGPALRPGIYDAPASPADIAPTLAVMFGIERPSQATGRVLREALERDWPETR